MKITLEGEKPMSWNTLYSGQHWSHRAAEAQRVHTMVKYARRSVAGSEQVYALRDNPTFPSSVDITITAYFKNRPLDADNIASKFYIDGLKGWLIKDDSPEYVRSVTTVSKIDNENPRVEIEIEEAK